MSYTLMLTSYGSDSVISNSYAHFQITDSATAYEYAANDMAYGLTVAQIQADLDARSEALWTAAHHDLDVVFLILNNREYRILKHNMDAYRQRFGVRAERPYAHMDLGKPEISFVDIAHGMGVPAARVTRPGELAPALAAALGAGGPYLLDVVVEGKR